MKEFIERRVEVLELEWGRQVVQTSMHSGPGSWHLAEPGPFLETNGFMLELKFFLAYQTVIRLIYNQTSRNGLQ